MPGEGRIQARVAAPHLKRPQKPELQLPHCPTSPLYNVMTIVLPLIGDGQIERIRTDYTAWFATVPDCK
jgi:hypothetical protein